MLEKQLQLIRSQDRITTMEVIEALFTEVMEVHGDRILGDDPTLFGAVGLLEQQPVTILGVNRGRTMKERQRFNGGQVRVSGYRKALRLVEAAEKFGRPVVTLIDMPGADASVESENHGQSQAIADLIQRMGNLKVPNIAIFLGEGHSGGALAFANVNRIVMLENALFSVASPEAVAAIVSTDQDVSEFLPMTAEQLFEIGLADEMIVEDQQMLPVLKSVILKQLGQLLKLHPAELINNRTNKFENVLKYWQTIEK